MATPFIRRPLIELIHAGSQFLVTNRYLLLIEYARRTITRDLIPVVLIGRLAVDKAFTRQGIGVGLLKDALLRILGAAEEIGIRAVLVHAIDDAARNFYLKHGFYLSSSDDYMLMLTVNDIQAAIC